MADLEITTPMARCALNAGAESNAVGSQRTVPDKWAKYPDEWLCGFDRKPWIYGAPILKRPRKIRNTP